MNVLEQLQALGFEEEPLQFYDGGDTDGGQGPGGTDVGAENTADYGGPGLGPGGTDVGAGSGTVAADGVGQSGFGSIGNFAASGHVGFITDSSGSPIASGTPGLAWTGSASSPGFGQTTSPGAELQALQEAINAGLSVAGTPTADAAVAQAVANAFAGTLTAADIAALNAAGLGYATGFNLGNPSQSVAEMQAAQNFAQYGVPLALSVIPGAGFAQALGRGLGALAEGKASVGQTIANTAISIAASQLGVPASTAMAMVNGEFGKAAANTAMGAITGVVSNITGLPSGLVTAGLSLTGAGKSISDTIAQTVNEAFSGSGAGAAGAAGQGFAFGDIGQGFASGDSGQLGFGASDLNTASLAPGIDSSSAAMPYSSGALNTLGALGALGVLSPRQETESSKRYQTAQVPAESPFGLMYGMRG